MKHVEFCTYQNVVQYYTHESLILHGGRYLEASNREVIIADQWNGYHCRRAGKSFSEYSPQKYNPGMDAWAEETNNRALADAFPVIPGWCRVFILAWWQLPGFRKFMQETKQDKYIVYEAPPAANRNYPARDAKTPYLRNTLVIVNYPEELKNA